MSPTSKKKYTNRPSRKIRFSWSEQNESRLILAVEKQRPLWDCGVPEYKLAHQKQYCWEAVAQELSIVDVDFNEARKKWNIMRSNFKVFLRKLRTKKSGQGADVFKNVKYPHFSELLFIESAGVEQSTQSTQSTSTLALNNATTDRLILNNWSQSLDYKSEIRPIVIPPLVSQHRKRAETKGSTPTPPPSPSSSSSPSPSPSQSFTSFSEKKVAAEVLDKFHHQVQVDRFTAIGEVFAGHLRNIEPNQAIELESRLFQVLYSFLGSSMSSRRVSSTIMMHDKDEVAVTDPQILDLKVGIPRSLLQSFSAQNEEIASTSSMMTTDIKFNPSLTTTDPHVNPVLIIGQLRHLNLVKFPLIQCKLAPRVTEETFKHAVSCLHPSPTDTCSLYLDLATIAALPLKSSRHNTSSRAHAITNLVKNKTMNVNDIVVIVCERADIFASGCAVVRAFPLYSRKTGSSNGNSATLNNTVSIEFVVIEKDGQISTSALSAEDIACLEETARGIRLAAKIVDMPCNEMNVSHFIDEVKAIAEELSLTPAIIRGEKLQELGFGGIYGVGKAAAVPPALVVLSYEPKGANDTIALVGKGIVYDTGGLSIKGKTAMPGMKRDCGGAAAILGAFYAAVKCGFKENLHAVFCLAENSVGPNATRPDDVHTLYSGRTVEINNTDAEGRLVLADGVTYAQKDLKANIILDMATLTGAQGIATGKYHGAILTNSEDWEVKSLEAGRKSGDLLAPIIYCPELHFAEFASAIADMKNSVADRNNALSSCAGLFVAAHIGFDFSGVWMHVDMATPVHCGERATGYGVALLLALFGNHTNCPMLQSIAPTESEPPSKRICRD